ncbi:AraC family transcriptional regulator [Marinilabiliaceae bacterium JC040]|nr:AraC family transcriptional regulator [Marinilabiliaceae bacterium JC040]
MLIENVPEVYQGSKILSKDLFLYDLKMTEAVVKSKIDLSMNMFSFLQEGTKQIHFSESSVVVNKNQSLLIKKGNLLWTELIDSDSIYYCKLFFFSESMLKSFLNKYTEKNSSIKKGDLYFEIENDSYISLFLDSLSNLMNSKLEGEINLLKIKFEEIMLYLLNKYGKEFEYYLRTLISKESSSLKNVIENNIYSNLKLEEIAFLCNMSLSSFKRTFIKEYGVSPGKWLQEKRLMRAKDLLECGDLKVSDIYYDLGYGNLSNFSSAFKKYFGVNPSEYNKNK